MPQPHELQGRLDEVAPVLLAVEERALELHKAVDIGIDVGEIARLGRALDAAVTECTQATSFLEPGPLATAFASCSGLAHSVAGHAMASVGFGSMAQRTTWKSRWDNVWSGWLRTLARRDQVLEQAGLSLLHGRKDAQDRHDGMTR